jgi:hypothetical protein
MVSVAENIYYLSLLKKEITTISLKYAVLKTTSRKEYMHILHV